MYYDKISLYRKMLDISREMNLPKAYKTDVTKHDKRMVVEMGEGSWYWVLRDCGSHFFSSDDLGVIRPALTQVNVRAVFLIRCFSADSCSINEIPVGMFFTAGCLAGK